MALDLPAVPVQPPLMQVTFWIQTPRKLISEAHWYYKGNASLDEALGAGKTLATLRAGLLTSNCRLLEVRAAIQNIYADSLCLSAAVNYQGYVDTGPLNLSEDSQRVVLSSGTQYRANFYLAPVPDAYMTNDVAVPGKSQVWQADRDHYLDVLCGLNGQPAGIWGFPAVTRDPSITPRCKIVGIQGTFGNSYVTVTTLTPHLLQPDMVARLERWPFASATYPFNAVWTVGAVTATTLQLTDFPVLTPSFSLGGGGTLQGNIRVWQPYDRWQLKALTTHKRDTRGRLYSWEIMDDAYKGLLNPGCYAMAILPRNEAYFTQARIFRDNDTEVTIRWFSVPFGTPFLPVPHYWGGKPWRYDRTPPTDGLGELMQSQSKHDRGFPPNKIGDWLGSDDWWANGVPFAAVGSKPQVRPGLCTPNCIQPICVTSCSSGAEMPWLYVMDPFPEFAGLKPGNLVRQNDCSYSSNGVITPSCPEGTSRAWLVELPTAIDGLDSAMLFEVTPGIFTSCCSQLGT